MLLDSALPARETSVTDKQELMETPTVFKPEHVRVGYKIELTHKERQKWLKTRIYSKNKPIHSASE
ncbi:MAG: hypothetical protein ACFKPT_18045 [Gloeotrichia echinulata GP01]|jgi:hypothetical protein